MRVAGLTAFQLINNKSLQRCLLFASSTNHAHWTLKEQQTIGAVQSQKEKGFEWRSDLRDIDEQDAVQACRDFEESPIATLWHINVENAVAY